MSQAETTEQTQAPSGAKLYNPGSKITGKLLIRGTLLAKTPLIIGCGQSETADIEILREPFANIPYIPGTSLAGVIRHKLARGEFMDDESINSIFGFSNKDQGSMSQIFFRDAYASNNAHVRIRDSVRINNKTGTAVDKGKFDYEIVESGAQFSLFIEINIRKSSDETMIQKAACMIHHLFSGENFCVGAKTNAGFGCMELKNDEFLKFNFTEPAHVKNWLLRKYEDQNFKQWDTEFSKLMPEGFTIPDQENLFSFNGTFRIKNSLIIGSAPFEGKYDDADSVMMQGRNPDKKPAYVLPGTSIRGAIRHQAEKIFNTFHNDIERFHDLFGFVDTNNDGKKIKSRVQVQEHYFTNPILKLQMRNKINRFTGGTFKTALFNSVPVWKDKEDAWDKAEDIVNIRFKAEIRKNEDWEAGILLLIIKDLWNGQLAIGGEKNVGRGILSGFKGTITFRGRSITLDKENDQIKLSEIDQEKSTNAENFLNNLIQEFRKQK